MTRGGRPRPLLEVLVCNAYHGRMPRFARRLLWGDRRAWRDRSCRGPRLTVLEHLLQAGLKISAEERQDGSLFLFWSQHVDE